MNNESRKREKRIMEGLRKEDYVSYELAKILKASGYDIFPNVFYFTRDDKPFEYKEGEMTLSSHEINGEEITVYAPTLWDAQRWIREIKNISVEPYVNASGWNFEICKCDGTHVIDSHKVPYDEGKMGDSHSYNSYEIALNEGIKVALKYI